MAEAGPHLEVHVPEKLPHLGVLLLPVGLGVGVFPDLQKDELPGGPGLVDGVPGSVAEGAGVDPGGVVLG
ncbi:uncharacterized protein TTMY_1420 [Thermus thermophilus]|nr:uncharacterized protein TTMY_1420 [Thermus thermophilus]